MDLQDGKRSACPTTTHTNSATVGQAHRLPNLDARTAWLIAIFVALLHVFLAVTAVNTKSPTFDEPQHLTAGYSYWTTNDYRLDPENGNLPARWAALPLLFSGSKFVSLSDREWQSADEGGTAHQFLYQVGNDPTRMIADARMIMSIFGLALCLLIYRITREFFGVVGGLLAETVAAFDPNFLAHSPLVTSDVPAAFFFTAAIWSCCRLFRKISPGRLVIAALSLSGLFLTKFSAPIVLPVIGIMSTWQIFSNHRVALQFRRFEIEFAEKCKKAGAISALWMVLGATVGLAIWSSFSFRYSALTDNGPSRKVWNNCWDAILSDHTPVQNAISYARAHQLLPEAYLCGFAYTQKSTEIRPAFLDGSWSVSGFASFFPRALLYKTSLPLLGLLGLSLFGAMACRRSWTLEKFLNPLFLFTLVYTAFAIGSRLNIGHRHLLPIYPALFIGCGSVIQLMNYNRRAIFALATALLLFWQIGESVVIRPHYLAYFNPIAGGPKHGCQHLVDSSLDWGQDLPSLKSWIDNHRGITRGKPLYLAYFGSADPPSYGISAKVLPENHSTGDRSLVPLRGGVYCISATILQSVYAPEIGPWSRTYEQQYQAALAMVERYRKTASDPEARVTLITNEGAVSWVKRIREFERLRFERLCAYLRHRKPDAEVGYSIFVFDLTDAEVDAALCHSPAELTSDIYVAGF